MEDDRRIENGLYFKKFEFKKVFYIIYDLFYVS